MDDDKTMTEDKESRDPVQVAIGAYLKRRAKKEGITNEQAAKTIEVGTATISRIYSGAKESGHINIFKLLRLVNGSIEHIYALIDDPSMFLAIEFAEQPTGPREDTPLGNVVRQLADDAVGDPGIVDAVGGFLAGRRSRR